MIGVRQHVNNDLTSAKSAVSFVTSETSADVEALSVGAQGVGVAIVWLILKTLINVWI